MASSSAELGGEAEVVEVGVKVVNVLMVGFGVVVAVEVRERVEAYIVVEVVAKVDEEVRVQAPVTSKTTIRKIRGTM